MIPRKLEKKILELAQFFPVLALLGPRQSGKTTLVRKLFPEHGYVNLEKVDKRELAIQDPSYFLKTFAKEKGLIIDEVQHAPDLFSYIQLTVDEKQQNSQFIITGSHNFLLGEAVSQSLAGRVALFDLLPLSIEELDAVGYLPDNVNRYLIRGSYPKLYTQPMTPFDWYNNYIRTYLERDVRQIKNVADLTTFQKFLRLCAGRCGQRLNLSDLARDCGVSHQTAKGWLSILEASYIIFLLQPCHNNHTKKFVKTPKLYFYDTGLALALLQVESEQQLATHFLRGNLFENLVIADLIKQSFNVGRPHNCYFWGDDKGREIDCILEHQSMLYPIEIKVSETVKGEYFQHLRYWCQRHDIPKEHAFLIYGGQDEEVRRDGMTLPWTRLSEFRQRIRIV